MGIMKSTVFLMLKINKQSMIHCNKLKRKKGSSVLRWSILFLENTSMQKRENVTSKRSILRSEEHTSELQSRFDLVCRLLLEKKKEKVNEFNEINDKCKHKIQ